MTDKADEMRGLVAALYYLYGVTLAAAVYVGWYVVVLPALVCVLVILYVSEYFYPARKGKK